MSETKEKILEVSLELFAQRGYSAVSIRDICGQVGIKESSVYYHFENKQAIFEEILARFQKIAADMMGHLVSAMAGEIKSPDGDFYAEINDWFFERYLMDDFCNKVMRLMAIEQFSNKNAREIYDYWMFAKPLEFQTDVFQRLIDRGALPAADGEYAAIQYYAPIFFFAQRWLFSGALTDENKDAFRKDAYRHIQRFFSELGGAGE